MYQTVLGHFGHRSFSLGHFSIGLLGLKHLGHSNCRRWTFQFSVFNRFSGFLSNLKYRKNSKNWDTLNYHRDCPTNGIVAFYRAILSSKDSDRITNRVDTDQTAP